SSSGPTIRGQQPVGDGEEWVRPMLADCGAAAVGPSYVAVPGSGCRTCPVRTSCPADELGEQVTV
ncbi:MAG: PD-(D/E)XK nuclease family protein, partial [Bifidobacteriaceae bacterium]|nr:PD-(D/E)XK nuclease family protein [Bifidobacteriaceae bacterium]